MKVGFTGTRKGCTKAQLRSLAQLLVRDLKEMEEAHHGDCMGADEEFALLANNQIPKERVHVHPPVNEEHRAHHVQEGNVVHPPYSHFRRNRNIVDGTDILVACPMDMEHQNRGGTWYTHDYAVKQGKPIYIVWPNGKIQRPEETVTVEG